MKLKKSSKTIRVGRKYTIKAKTNSSGTITFSSSNKRIVSVSKKGVIKAKKAGKATITVKCNGVTKKFKVKVVR
ncbi:MAG: Ig-like domain-containing protein [Clostridiales bacterium]|nr:Ig-like domain-containing protein [Clostridiales bacterium]